MKTAQRVVGVVAGLGLSAGLLSACTDDKSDRPSSPTASSSQNQGPEAAAALAKELLATRTEGGTAPAASVAYPGTSVEIGVESIVATSSSTVVNLAARHTTDGQQLLPGSSAEDQVAFRDLHQLSVQDDAAKVRYYPYRFLSVPSDKKSGSTSPGQQAVIGEKWQSIGAAVLPPLTGSPQSLDVNLPRGLNDSTSLGTAAAATIEDVPVEGN